ncbi:MAG TPA: trehalose-6-phosphate synthase [Candidatus Binatia bacterium]|nr:trehalose-6-phosphate synthase [Candidatus Binatia bacterium]
MSRLVAVSNRVASVRGAARAGGLAVALADALRTRGGVLFGWSGRISDNPGRRNKQRETDNLTLVTVDLTAQEHENYYLGYSNRCLWPLLHYRPDLTAYERRYEEGYRQVNQRFARSLISELRPDDIIWVQDYHLIPLGAELRALGAQQPIGFFLHTSFPSREVLATLPNHEGLARSFLAYDLVGVQTEGDRERFCEFVSCEGGARIARERLHAAGRSTLTRCFPVGIDPQEVLDFSRTGDGEREYQRMAGALRGRELMIGVDRLDYTKGLLRRLRAFEVFLAEHEDARRKVELLQVAPVSREEVQAYQDFRHELELAASRINGRFADSDWTPVRYVNHVISRQRLAGLYRASRVGFVTPVRDGMNLVAKEYVAAQDPADPGVLVLSRFAGAAAQMTAALLVNPYDAWAVADALQAARTMPLEERRDRHQDLWRGLLAYDAARWCREFLDTLATEGAESRVTAA